MDTILNREVVRKRNLAPSEARRNLVLIQKLRKLPCPAANGHRGAAIP